MLKEKGRDAVSCARHWRRSSMCVYCTHYGRSRYQNVAVEVVESVAKLSAPMGEEVRSVVIVDGSNVNLDGYLLRQLCWNL
jgi:tyrosine-protein phosphatase YwqE